MRTMYDIIKDGYAASTISKTGLKKAVARKWIIEAEYKEICGEDYSTTSTTTDTATTSATA